MNRLVLLTMALVSSNIASAQGWGGGGGWGSEETPATPAKGGSKGAGDAASSSGDAAAAPQTSVPDLKIESIGTHLMILQKHTMNQNMLTKIPT